MGISSRTGRFGLHTWVAVAAVLGTALAGCGGGSDSVHADVVPARTSRTTNSTATVTLAQPANTEGRLLASNCFQCHGTMGMGGFDKIRGSEASEVLEYMTRTAGRDIMAAHAQGDTPEQLKKIFTYLQQ